MLLYCTRYGSIKHKKETYGGGVQHVVQSIHNGYISYPNRTNNKQLKISQQSNHAALSVV